MIIEIEFRVVCKTANTKWNKRKWQLSYDMKFSSLIHHKNIWNNFSRHIFTIVSSIYIISSEKKRFEIVYSAHYKYFQTLLSGPWRTSIHFSSKIQFLFSFLSSLNLFLDLQCGVIHANLYRFYWSKNVMISWMVKICNWKYFG